MKTFGKVIVFLIVFFVVTIVFVLIKESTGAAVMWIGAMIMLAVGRSMFGKKKTDNKNVESKDITLNKD